MSRAEVAVVLALLARLEWQMDTQAVLWSPNVQVYAPDGYLCLWAPLDAA